MYKRKAPRVGRSPMAHGWYALKARAQIAERLGDQVVAGGGADFGGQLGGHVPVQQFVDASDFVVRDVRQDVLYAS